MISALEGMCLARVESGERLKRRDSVEIPAPRHGTCHNDGYIPQPGRLSLRNCHLFR